MTRYFVSNSKGSFVKDDVAGSDNAGADTATTLPDSLQPPVRQRAMPQRANNTIPLLH